MTDTLTSMDATEASAPHCANEDNHAPHAVFCRDTVHVCAGVPVVAQFDADTVPVCKKHRQTWHNEGRQFERAGTE